MIERISSNNTSSQIGLTPRREEMTGTLNEGISQDVKDSQRVSVNEDKLKEIVKGMNDFLGPAHTSLKFEYHEKLNEYYVTLVDEVTREVVREIPPKKMLDFYAAMTEKIGILVDRKI